MKTLVIFKTPQSHHCICPESGGMLQDQEEMLL